MDEIPIREPAERRPAWTSVDASLEGDLGSKDGPGDASGEAGAIAAAVREHLQLSPESPSRQRDVFARIDARITVRPRRRSFVTWRGNEGVKIGVLGGQTLRHVIGLAGAVMAVVLAFIVLSYNTHPESVVTRVYTTHSGQQTSVTLIDGTRVTLAPNTTLRAVRFGASSRTVLLDGQGYFEVARSTGAPFLVRTGNVTTQVLGTAFLVRHYGADERVHIAVAEGRVGILSQSVRQHMHAPLILTAGYVSDVTDSTVLVNTAGDVNRETDWLRGRLVFRHAPIGEVLQTLSRWYGYQFRCSDSTMIRKSVTLALNAQSSADALSTLEQVLSVSLTMVGDTVTLVPRTTRATNGNSRKQAYDIWIPTREVGR